MDVAVARIRDQARERRLAWCLAVLREHWLAWRRQIMWARHLRHGCWGWLVTAPHRQDLRRSSTKAVMRLGYTDGSFHRVRVPPGGRISLFCIAECATVSGRGYYAIEPALDVLRRPDRREGVLARPPDGVNVKQHRAHRC